jgi:ribonucleotide reductase beta subunit family protein with ferritin-like domain
LDKQSLKIIYTSYNKENFDKEAEEECDNIYEDIVQSETKWRTEVLYKIVLELDV